MLLPEEPPLLPDFISGYEEKGGVARGTIYHNVLERLCLSATDTKEEIEAQLDQMEREKQLTDTERRQVNAWKLWKLFSSPIGKRIRLAEKEGRLFREQPFVIGRQAKEFYNETESTELVLLQGIIDVFFEEDNELVLLDYKTDYVGANGIEFLKKRYHTQFECYKQALEQITGKTVKEMILYSFAMDKAVNF